MLPIIGKAAASCIGGAQDQLERHQMGFDGEHIGEQVLKDVLKYKGVKLTRHKAKFDIITDHTCWEVKTMSKAAKHKQMNVKTAQRKAKIAWAKENKKKPKSMMVIVNDSCEVYITDGVGAFRPGNMKKIKTSKNWRKEFGHGRTERKVVKEERIKPDVEE